MTGDLPLHPCTVARIDTCQKHGISSPLKAPRVFLPRRFLRSLQEIRKTPADWDLFGFRSVEFRLTSVLACAKRSEKRCHTFRAPLASRFSSVGLSSLKKAANSRRQCLCRATSSTRAYHPPQKRETPASVCSSVASLDSEIRSLDAQHACQTETPLGLLPPLLGRVPSPLLEATLYEER